MIEVGEYVRTKDGYIFKILTKENTNYGCCGITDSNNTKYTTYTYNKRSFNDIKNKIVKHSKNIIDLIEVGDYVNGYKVITVDTDAPNNCKECIELDRNNAYEYQWISRNEIKAILTKELYQANCYTVTVERKEE